MEVIKVVKSPGTTPSYTVTVRHRFFGITWMEDYFTNPQKPTPWPGSYLWHHWNSESAVRSGWMRFFLNRVVEAWPDGCDCVLAAEIGRKMVARQNEEAAQAYQKKILGPFIEGMNPACNESTFDVDLGGLGLWSATFKEKAKPGVYDA